MVVVAISNNNVFNSKKRCVYVTEHASCTISVIGDLPHGSRDIVCI